MLKYGNLKLFESLILGSHNSGTSQLSLDIKTVNPKGLPKCLNSIIYKWSVCQTLSISEQLEFGVRYFDIRIRKYQNDFYVVHGLTGNKISWILNEFKDFITKNNDNIVIISINQDMYDSVDQGFNFTDEDKNLVKGMINDMFKDELITHEQVNECSIKELLDKNLHYFVSYHDNLINDFWPNKNKFVDLKNMYIAEMLNRNEFSNLHVDQCILTPKAVNIMFNYSLKSYVEDNTNDFKELIRTYIRRFNIITLDFINEENYNELKNMFENENMRRIDSKKALKDVLFV